jgi:CheY-like chemotaxis protein
MVRILLADDDAELRSLLAAGFRRYGFEVIEIGDGAALLEFVEKAAEGKLPEADRPDVIVADVYMPGANGLESLARMRNAPDPIPVVILTGFEAHDAATTLGAAAVFRKPVELPVLRAKLCEIAAKHLRAA